MCLQGQTRARTALGEHQEKPGLKEGELGPPRGSGNATTEVGKSRGFISFGQNGAGVGQTLGSLTA